MVCCVDNVLSVEVEVEVNKYNQYNLITDILSLGLSSQ